MSPKRVYNQLKRLIHEEWKTRVSGTTDDSGRFACRGFSGHYRIVIETPGGPVEKALCLKTGEARELTVTLAPGRDLRQRGEEYREVQRKLAEVLQEFGDRSTSG